MANIKISEMPALSPITGAECLAAYDATKAVAQQNQRLQIQQILPPGGSTGQLPAKTSAADYDIQWVNPPSGGGGDYSVLNIDFTPNEAVGGVASSPVILSTYSMPAATLPATGELLIESYVTYVQGVGDVASNFPSITLTHRLGGVTFISRLAVPYIKGDSSSQISGYAKFETRIQAMNSTSSQYNDGQLRELTENFSDGAYRSVVSNIEGQYPPMDTNFSSVDMTAAMVVELVALRGGTGNATSKVVHKFTRVSLISP